MLGYTRAAWLSHSGLWDTNRTGVARVPQCHVAGFEFRGSVCKGAPVDSPGVLEAALTTQGLASTREPSQTEEVTECSKSGGYSPLR
jgi:hypothetical protein